MERLTYWNEEYGCWSYHCGSGEAANRLAAYEDTRLMPKNVEALKLSAMGKAIAEITEFDGLPIDRLRELAEADKDGRVVVLPCKVGDTVYVLYGKGYIPYIVDRFHILANKDVQARMRHFTIGTLWLSSSAFGKTVFLTREEAEKAVLEAKSND